MLSESFLRTAVYRERMNAEEQKDEEKSQKKTSSWALGAALSDRREGGSEPLCQGEASGPISQPLRIPRREVLNDASLDLYTSWSSRYGSIYKNYPDLHIAGDHILQKVDSGCILDGDCEDGPVLLSADIDRSSPPTENPGGLLTEGGPPSVESQVLPSAPFSNSVLNGFLEKKMAELYKQCYEEKLTAAGTSPIPHLWSTVLMHNVHLISLQMSQERNVHQSTAMEAILRSLRCATSGGSSEFITPILHISSPDKPEAPASNLPFINSSRGQSKK
ncbi:TLR adapter interacting with SLC15A4 on the lysosome-like [Bufo gargarizans]|uniref:TLR adapter interacting with SLC15A4 on the lysosome-like n=1 Tax=Bufo gargarizans TaxID=30331 RepID=UPI001CF0DDCD|nr:TLR adapter interacting with SLC15A4 on the lysosome-like [Bufo gargarizans]